MKDSSIIWNYFTKKRNNEGIIISYSCKFCGLIYTNKNATRKQKHLFKKCLDCPESTKRLIRNNVNVNEIEQIEMLNKTDESQFVNRPGNILINSLLISII